MCYSAAAGCPGSTAPVAGDIDIEQSTSTTPGTTTSAGTPDDTRHYRIVAGAPQLIRVSGFRDVFERYYNQLDQAICNFGVDQAVDCRCDTLHGVIECTVPRFDVVPSACDTLVVKAHIAEFETPPLAFRYCVCDEDNEHDNDANCMLRPSEGAVLFDRVSGVSKCTPALPVVVTGAKGGKQTTRANSENSTEQQQQVEQEEEEQDDDEEGEERTSLSLQKRALAAISREHVRNKSSRAYTLMHQCIAEFIGTMFIVVFGVGSVCSAVLLKESVPLWHIATVWGFGVALAILATASVSGAHLNPAVSLALAMFRPGDFALSKLLPYWAAQYLGGVAGGALNLMIFGSSFAHFEAENNIIRNDPASGIRTAAAFGEYFPAPGAPLSAASVSPAFAMFVEAWGTGILMFIILALTDSRHKLLRNKEMIPFYIGFTVAVLITLYAPLTQAGWNPARDFGPRVVAALAGWGKVAIPGPRNGFWVYIVGPKLGAPVGALLYDFLIRPGLHM